MSNKNCLIVLVFIFTFFSNQHGTLAKSKLERPNSLGVEIAGKSFAYSFNFQRMFGYYLGCEGGISYLFIDDGNRTVLFFPLGLNAYVYPQKSTPFFTAGMVFLSTSVDSGLFDDSTSESYPYLGVGFQYRADGGFVFKATAYMLKSGDGSSFFWPGLHFGYAF